MRDSKKSDLQNPLEMIPDPYDGKTFILPATPCTDERRLFFKRMNEILGFLYVTCLCYNEYRNHFEKLVPKLPFKENTPIKIEWKASKSVVMPARRVLNFTKEGLDILARQIFVMIYGSFETYLYQLFERSYSEVGITEDLIEMSLDILMRRRWDGKFSKMAHVFGFEYRASHLADHFSNLEMNFSGKIYRNPLDFLDDLVQIRHKIVHASSILEKGQLIFIDINFIPEFFFFFYHLTDFIDDLFAKRFGYLRPKVKSAEA